MTSTEVERRHDSLILAFLLTLFMGPVGLCWTAWKLHRNWRVQDSTEWLLMFVFGVFWSVVFFSVPRMV